MRHTLRTLGLGLLTALGTQLTQGLFASIQPAQAQYIITLPNQVVCEGQFSGYTGNGICQYPDGYYRGDIVNGQRQGRGVFYYYGDDEDGEGETLSLEEFFQLIFGGTLPDEGAGNSDLPGIAATYDGEFRNDRPNGRGRFVYANDYRYEGEVRDGLPHGTGLFVFLTNPPSVETEDIPGEPFLVTQQWKQEEYLSRYYGQFANGLFSGRGTLIFGICRVYQINGRDDLRCARYDGQFRNGRPHGRGTYNDDVCIIRNGQYDCIRFSGNFWGGQPNGQGTLSFPNYGRCDGQFNDYTMSGRGTCRYNNGDRYTGDLRNGVPHGAGTAVFADGTRFTGEFRLGDPFTQTGIPVEDLSTPTLGGGFPTYPGRP
ncbi:MAG: MORN repeat-containing protein [Spirulinaceae cyanobacterium]